ncbi:MAG: IPT/TIG domain-containing protein [Nannocystaceae bacterium]|nr:IPT/TIG domain-containing protein [Nannocystaceae bacterium]
MFVRAYVVMGLLVAGCGAPDSNLRMSPAAVRQGGGQSILIEGDDFTGHGPLVVYFGGRAAKGVVIESPWLVSVKAPQSERTGAVDVLLRFGDGTEQSLDSGFEYEEQPGIVLQPRIGGRAPPP